MEKEVIENLTRDLLPHTHTHAHTHTTKATFDGTHPHQWTPPEVMGVWRRSELGEWRHQEESVENFICHNGDLDAFEIGKVSLARSLAPSLPPSLPLVLAPALALSRKHARLHARLRAHTHKQGKHARWRR